MSSSIKYFKNIMKCEEIRGQRILTSFLAPEKPARVEIFAKNIPEDLDEDQIIPFFECVGPVHTFRLMMNKNNDGNRGFAYVIYLNSEDAEVAVKVLDGKDIIKNYPVKIAHSMNNCRIFLGGIPVRRTKDEVWQELEKKGVTNIIDVIMYRSYNNRANNRGFVFVEFPSHQYAAKMRNKMKGMMLWNNEVIVDWSVPEAVVPDEDMKMVKILYLRNLNVTESREYLKAIIEKYVNPQHVLKVYKFKNYAFVHLISRKVAEDLLNILKDVYRNTPVEVMFAKPPSEYTKPEYRKQILAKVSRTDMMKHGNASQLSHYNISAKEEPKKFERPLREIENSFHPKYSEMFQSNPLSCFSSFKNLKTSESDPPSQGTELSFIPMKLEADKPMRWFDILKREEGTYNAVDPSPGVGEPLNMQPVGVDVLKRKVRSNSMKDQENMATEDLPYSHFESQLRARRGSVPKEQANQQSGFFESSPDYKLKTLPTRELPFFPSEELHAIKEQENIENLGNFSSCEDLRELLNRMKNVKGKMRTTKSKPFTSIRNYPAEGRQNYMTPQSFLRADISSTESCDQMSFNVEYINELLSD